jgi:hypothetical protein
MTAIPFCEIMDALMIPGGSLDFTLYASPML